MIRITRKIGMCIALLALAACGKVGDLEPRAGKSMPPLAYGQNGEQTAEKLTTPSPQARPARSDELVSKSAAREDDPFDFAPGQTVPPFPGTKEDDNVKNGADKDKSSKPE